MVPLKAILIWFILLEATGSITIDGRIQEEIRPNYQQQAKPPLNNQIRTKTTVQPVKPLNQIWTKTTVQPAKYFNNQIWTKTKVQPAKSLNNHIWTKNTVQPAKSLNNQIWTKTTVQTAKSLFNKIWTKTTVQPAKSLNNQIWTKTTVQPAKSLYNQIWTKTSTKLNDSLVPGSLEKSTETHDKRTGLQTIERRGEKEWTNKKYEPKDIGSSTTILYRIKRRGNSSVIRVPGMVRSSARFLKNPYAIKLYDDVMKSKQKPLFRESISKIDRIYHTLWRNYDMPDQFERNNLMSICKFILFNRYKKFQSRAKDALKKFDRKWQKRQAAGIISTRKPLVKIESGAKFLKNDNFIKLYDLLKLIKIVRHNPYRLEKPQSRLSNFCKESQQRIHEWLERTMVKTICNSIFYYIRWNRGLKGVVKKIKYYDKTLIKRKMG